MAIECDRLEVPQWLLERRPKFFQRFVHVNHTINHGHLRAAKWLVTAFPKRYFSDPHCRFRAQDHSKIDLAHVQWVLQELDWAEHKARLAWMDEAMGLAAAPGNLDMPELVWRAFVKSVSIDQAELSSVLKPDLIDKAAANGHLAILRWLQDHHCPACTH